MGAKSKIKKAGKVIKKGAKKVAKDVGPALIAALAEAARKKLEKS